MAVLDCFNPLRLGGESGRRVVVADELRLGANLVRVVDEVSRRRRRLRPEDVLDCFYFAGAPEEGCWAVFCGAALDEGDAPQFDRGIIESFEDSGAGHLFFCVSGIIDTESVLLKNPCVSLLDHGDQAEEVVVQPSHCVSFSCFFTEGEVSNDLFGGRGRGLPCP